jgi:hypothetical protein
MDVAQLAKSKNESSRTDAQWESLLRDLRLSEDKCQKLQSVTDTLEGVVRSACAHLPAEPPPRIEISKSSYPEEKAVLLFSDAQIGSYVSKYYTGGLCGYDKTEFSKRIKRLTKNALEVIRIQRGGGIPVKQLQIHVLGDIVQGESVFPGQAFQLDALLLEQSLVLAQKIVDDVFIPLSREFEKVEILCVPGNHGRQGGPYNASRMANWDYVTYFTWMMRMQEFSHVKFYISASPFLIYDLFPGQTHALIHGNQAKGWLGYPYYGIDRLFHRLTSLAGMYIMYLHHGHHHQPSIQDTHIGRKVGNGSIEGGSDYSVGDLTTANVPQQHFCGFNAKGVTWEYWLRLADQPKMKKDAATGLFTPTMEFH